MQPINFQCFLQAFKNKWACDFFLVDILNFFV